VSEFVRPPARGYSWPPFEAGNTAALKHGASSPRKIRPIAEEIREVLLAEAPWIDRPAFAGAVRSLCWTEAQVVLLTEWLNEHGVLRDRGVDELEPQPRAATRLLRDLENRAEKLRSSLALTPTSMAKMLGTLRAVVEDSDDGLMALKAEGRKMLAAREDAEA
jgi:hypothetical protein